MYKNRISREDKKGVFWGWGGGGRQQETLPETKPIYVLMHVCFKLTETLEWHGLC